MPRLRAATENDQRIIRSMVRGARLNPTGLDWKRFVVAENGEGKIIACGQLKIHKDGTKEVASIVVREDERGKGLGKRMIEQLMQAVELPLWLMCRSGLVPLYEHFGFAEVWEDEQLPPYFGRMKRLAKAFKMFTGMEEHLAVMLKIE
jgi:N-acetylglutamate synthase-like GNAT family acetyltransferase